MIDMDGTVYKGNKIIPGATDLIGYLKENNIKFLFLTNNSSNTRDHYCRKLRSMGIEIEKENILTSTVATVRFIKERRPGKKAYVIASPDVAKEIEDLGIPNEEDRPDIVLLTFDRTITFDKINKAYHHIMNGAELIVTHPDDLCPTETAYDVDVGQFARLLSVLTGVSPTIIGKPCTLMLDMAAETMGIEKEHAVMIGDRLYTDIRMANDAGTESIMVLTGEAKRSDLKDSNIQPTYVVDSVADIPDLILRIRI